MKIMTMVLTKTEIDLRNLNEAEFERLLSHPNPETFTLILESKRKRFFIGQIAYLARKREEDDVVESSLSFTRRAIVFKFLDWVYHRASTGDLAITTIEGRVRKTLDFFHWCDANNYQDFTQDAELGSVAYRAYSDHLKERVRLGEMHPTYASEHQGIAEDCLYWIFPTFQPESLQGIRRIQASSAERNATPVSDENDTAKNLALSQALFDGLTDFLINNAPFPFQLSLPNETCWVLPCQQWIRPAFRLNERNYTPNWSWNYETGQINDIDFIESKYQKGRSEAAKMYRRAQKNLQEANSNPHHHTRLGLAAWALKSFSFLFCNNVGGNRKSFLDQKWDIEWKYVEDDRLPQPQKKSIQFTTIKPRASRYTSFKITKTFIPQFEKFLKLRDFLLNGQEFEYLFFDYDQYGAIKKTSPHFLQTYFHLARKLLDPTIANISTRAIRASKGDWAQNNHRPEVAAELLQNNIGTAQKSYATGNETSQSLEFSNFFEVLSSRTGLIATDRPNNYTSLSNGGCNDFGKPKSIHPNAPTEPDCKNRGSCLWCEHFVLHADEEDAHKLFSMRYVFEKLGEFTDSSTRKNMIEPTIEAINIFIGKINSSGPDASIFLQRAESRVDGGYLSDYWSGKLDLLLDIGVIQ
ncbi:hypothetical protein [Pseudomonas sp. C11]|uniref:hypothetical protein n=1 Tax=Pseudomonas sp. C11 TaxID=3075550 RepID=UPI002AFEE493|nr:hypothetical protein [Pseudomonas sp. C11]